MSKTFLIASACLVGVLSTVGASLPYPILAPLFAGTAANSLNHFAGLPPKLLLGVLLAINPFGMFLGSALLGPLSDRFGRRTVLLSTTLFSAVGHAVSMLALHLENYPAFLVARFATGLAEGNASVARAMLADSLEGAFRVRAFAWLNGSITSGWALGPLLAGATAGFGMSVPFGVAAAVLGVTFLVGVVGFPKETRAREVGGTWKAMRQGNAFALLVHGPIREVVLCQLAYTFGVTAFYEFYPLWLVEFVKWGTTGIAVITALLALVMSGTSAVVGGGFGGALSPGIGSLGRYALATAIAIALVPLFGAPLGVVPLVAMAIPHSLFNAVFPVYCSDRFAAHGQGAVMGLLSTTFSLAAVGGTAIGAFVTLLDTRLILLLGAATSAWAAVRILRWNHAELSTQTETTATASL